MPEITKEWILSLSKDKLENVFSLGLYHYRATLMFVHVDEWWQITFNSEKTEPEVKVAIDEYLKHYLMMWASLVFVVQEGFVELGIHDKVLDRAVQKVGYDKLRRFRNATFHYQRRINDDRHLELTGNFSEVRAIFERQGVLMRRLTRLVRLRPDHSILKHSNNKGLTLH